MQWNRHREIDDSQDLISLLTTSLDSMHGLFEVCAEKMTEPVHHLCYYRQDALPQGDGLQVALHLPEQCSRRLVIAKHLVQCKHRIGGQCQRTVGNLRVEVSGLALSQPQILFAFAVHHFRVPANLLVLKCLHEREPLLMN